MAEYPGIMLYFDIRPALRRLTLEEKGLFFDAILEYGETGKTSALDGMPGIAFDLMCPRIDRDKEKYYASISQRKYATYCREAKKSDAEPLSYDEWYQSISTDDSRLSGNDSRYPTTDATANINASLAVKENKMDKPSIPPRKKYGQYGWVCLSEKEYTKLLLDLGEEELSRCINYIDESAQSNGNKNKWKDWNIVLRRCSREGWGHKNIDAEHTSPAPKQYRLENVDGVEIAVVEVKKNGQ